MDSFITSKHKTTWPEEVGYWWFYGYRYGKSDHYKFKPELMLCQVVQISNGTMVIAEGQNMYKSEVEEANFIPATLPELIDF